MQTQAHMLIKALLSLLAIAPMWGMGQVQRPDYFGRPLLRKSGVRTITVYETKIDNPSDQAGKGNRIRLAKNMVRQTDYDTTGLPMHSRWFQNQGNTTAAEATRTFDGEGRLLTELQHRFNTNLADSTRLIQTHLSRFGYGPDGKATFRVQSLVRESSRQLVDSVAYIADSLGRLSLEQVYALDEQAPRVVLQKVYTYDGNKVVVSSKVEGQELNRDEFELDAQGRVVNERNFGPGDERARLETIYRYDPRGWVEEVRFVPDWQHFEEAETVVCRKNKFDDHGKILEAQLDFGNGKRRFEFYDYTYWVER